MTEEIEEAQDDDGDLAPGPDDPRWQRRPVRSLVVQNVRILGTAAVAVLAIGRREIERWAQGGELEIGFASVLGLVVAGIGLLVALGSVLSWRRFTFAVTPDGLHVRRGGLGTTATTFSPERIDGVEVREPLLERLAGLATLRVEVSGGGASGGEVTGIPAAQAHRWREQLLARRAEVVERPGGGAIDRAEGADDGTEAVADAVADQERHERPAPPDDPRGRLVLALGTERARRYTLRSVQPWVSAVASLGLVTSGVADAVTGGVAGGLTLLLVGLAAGAGAVRSWLDRWRRVSTWEVHERDGDLVVSRGRLDRRRTTVRAGRVGAVELGQGPVDRRSGWWTLTVSITAFGASASADAGVATVAVAATPEEVVALTAVLLPDLDEAMLAEVSTALASARPPSTWIRSQPYARRFAPLTWLSRGLVVDATHLVVRKGRWARTVRVVDRRRIQTTSLEAGPLDRRWGGAALTVHLPPGPTRLTTVPHLDVATARSLRDGLALTRRGGATG